ncbi:MAG: D-inositol-3-phosphate glycosyltransferase [Kutzneria sp.]|nr:D-inositol-3-phosphate glycosyltransferase [Kutzneria sp.]
MHTSPLAQPGAGDAGGMNVYIAQTATAMAEQGVSVDVFTRSTSPDLPPTVELAPGVTVRHVVAGPRASLPRDRWPGQLRAFAAGVLRAVGRTRPSRYDVVHSHYWLSGHAGWLASRYWRVPLVHTAHTLAKVKNAALAAGDVEEPPVRALGEEQVVTRAHRLIANTVAESRDLVERYGADPARVLAVSPGVDLEVFSPSSRALARRGLGLPVGALVVAFVGRIQPLKAPDVLLRAVAELLARMPRLRADLVVLVVGGLSGTGFGRAGSLRELAAALGISDVVRFMRPRRGTALAEVYRAADVVAMPSHNESFGLVALEAQACGTPVIAAAVGGLPTAVVDRVTGVLVPDHEPVNWANALADVVLHPELRGALARNAVTHASRFSWRRTVDGLLDGYAGACGDFPGTPERGKLAG